MIGRDEGVIRCAQLLVNLEDNKQQEKKTTQTYIINIYYVNVCLIVNVIVMKALKDCFEDMTKYNMHNCSNAEWIKCVAVRYKRRHLIQVDHV